MVLQEEVYNGGYQKQSYSAYQGPTGGYNSYQSVADYTPPYSSPFQGSTYAPSHGGHQQSGWSSGGDYYGNGAGNYHGGGMPHPVKPATGGYGFHPVKPTTGGYGIHPVKPTTGGYGNPHYENSYTHENSHSHGNPHHQGHGSPHHQGHGSPNHQSYDNTHGFGHGNGNGHGHGHGSPQYQGHGNTQGYGKTHSFGSGITNKIHKLTHGHGGYGTVNPDFGPNPSVFNHQQQQPSWTLKGLDDE